MRISSALLGVLALGLALPSCIAAKAPNTFQEAQQCRINGTVEAEALVKYYDQAQAKSPAETAVRIKADIYAKASAVLDISERGELDDCKDEPNPDGCLRSRYCFKEAYIKVKNVLVANGPEKFQAEIRWFDKAVKGNC